MHFPCKVFLLWSILCKSKPRGPKINASNSKSDYSIIMFALRWEGGGVHQNANICEQGQGERGGGVTPMPTFAYKFF